MHVLSFDGTTWTASEVAAGDVRTQVKTDRLTWIRAAGIGPEDLARLCKDFGIHPLALEDVQNARQRPKVEAYPDLTFVVGRVPRWEDDLTWVQVGVFLGSDFLITASANTLPELDEVEQRRLKRGASDDDVAMLLHRILDAIVDAWFPYIEDLEAHVEGLEDASVVRADQDTLARIRESKQVISRTRKVSGPMRDAVLALERGEHPHVTAEAKLYLRDVSDHMVRIAERLEHVKEMAMFAQEGWNATLANQQNQTMKRLTVIFALFLVPTFVAGLGGMNFPGFPDWDYWTVTTAILAFVVVGGAVSWWQRWL